MTPQSDQFRLLPSIDELLHTSIGKQLVGRYSHSLVVQALRAVLAQVRAEIRAGVGGQGQAQPLQYGGAAEGDEPLSVVGAGLAPAFGPQDETRPLAAERLID